jgi:transcriptional regulator with XRE-family HTH domain
VTPDDIKALRKELGCSAKELAGALELDQATVLAWERAELFPTKRYVDRMTALRELGPSAIVKNPRGRAKARPKAQPTTMELLADPEVWRLVRKILVHGSLRAEVERIAAGYSDPSTAGGGSSAGAGSATDAEG